MALLIGLKPADDADEQRRPAADRASSEYDSWRERTPSMTRRLSALVLSAGFTVNSLAACGDEPVATPTVTRPTTPAPPPNSGKRLSRKEAFTIGVAVTAGHRQCNPRAGRVPTESELRELVEDLVAVARKKPDDIGCGQSRDRGRATIATAAAIAAGW